MKSKTEQPALNLLAESCWDGACNIYAIINGLSEAIKNESDPGEVRRHPAIKIIIGQLSFLLGESLGPSTSAVDAWKQWHGDLPVADPSKSTRPPARKILEL